MMIFTSPTGPARPAVKRGFTLLEALLTIVVLTSGLAMLMTALGQGIFASGNAGDLRIATALAQEKTEQLKDAAFSAVASEGRAPVAGFSGFEREVVVASSPGGTNANLKQAQVTVYWRTKGGELSTALTTYLVNH